jgi:hypothetical protein
MEGLFCGCSSTDDSTWTRSILQQTIRPDHGYNHDSPQIGWLIDMLLSFGREEVSSTDSFQLINLIFSADNSFSLLLALLDSHLVGFCRCILL